MYVLTAERLTGGTDIVSYWHVLILRDPTSSVVNVNRHPDSHHDERENIYYCYFIRYSTSTVS